jgi:hypothetical protein
MTVRSTPTEIIEIVAKYMDVLGVDNPPEVTIVDNLGSAWLGICRWTANNPNTSHIKLQRRILAHPPTLDRVLAHEMVHHWEFSQLTPEQVNLIRFGIKPESHGAKFREGSAKINQLVGEDYVTRTSDASYELSKNTREFYLLIMPMSHRNNRLGWAWAGRLTPQIRERIARECREGQAKLIKTTDDRWTVGAKIQRFGGISIPPVNSEYETTLHDLYDHAPECEAP